VHLVFVVPQESKLTTRQAITPSGARRNNEIHYSRTRLFYGLPFPLLNADTFSFCLFRMQGQFLIFVNIGHHCIAVGEGALLGIRVIQQHEHQANRTHAEWHESYGHAGNPTRTYAEAATQASPPAQRKSHPAAPKKMDRASQGARPLTQKPKQQRGTYTGTTSNPQPRQTTDHT